MFSYQARNALALDIHEAHASVGCLPDSRRFLAYLAEHGGAEDYVWRVAITHSLAAANIVGLVASFDVRGLEGQPARQRWCPRRPPRAMPRQIARTGRAPGRPSRRCRKTVDPRTKVGFFVNEAGPSESPPGGRTDMLLGLDPLLRGDLLAVLREMGHGDTICLADSNFPAASIARAGGAELVRSDADAVALGRAILSVMPLDSFVETPIWRMAPEGDPETMNEAHEAFLAMVHATAGARWTMGSIERFDFYPEAEKCVAVVATLERRPYANFILKKGVIGPDGTLG